MSRLSAAPRTLRLQDAGRRLCVEFSDAEIFELSAEYLRVFSPSAEVQGHGLAEPQIVGGKQAVSITRIDPVGRYAVRLVFSDAHDSGLYTWDTLRHLGRAHATLWARYLERLAEHGMSRQAQDNVMPLNALRPKNALHD